MSISTLRSMTKAELIQIISERNDETQAQRLRISVLEGELALRPRVAQTPARAAYLAREKSTKPTPFQLACAAAKAAAMAGGKVIRVGN